MKFISKVLHDIYRSSHFLRKVWYYTACTQQTLHVSYYSSDTPCIFLAFQIELASGPSHNFRLLLVLSFSWFRDIVQSSAGQERFYTLVEFSCSFPVFVDSRWFGDSCIHMRLLTTLKSKQNQNKYLYHFFRFSPGGVLHSILVR